MVALLDTNVLVYATYARSTFHPGAATLLDLALRKRGLFCIAPQNLVEFAAVVTRRRPGDTPLPMREVLRITDLLYRSRTLAKIYAQRGTVARAIRDGAEIGIVGSAWFDLFLALTMRDAGVRVVVTENTADFEKFPFVTTRTIAEAVSGELPARRGRSD